MPTDLGKLTLKTITFIYLLAFSLQSSALDLDRENISVSYLQLPTHPMVNIQDRTYSVLYNSAYFEQEFQDIIESNFHIEGFQRLYSNATLLVDFQFDEIEVLSTEVLENSRRVKDTDGKSHLEYYYIPVLQYKTYAKVYVSYANGESKTYKFGSRSQKYTGAEKYSTSEANRALSNDLHQIIHDLFSQFVIDTVRDVDSNLSEKHGYRAIDTTDYLLILDSKRYPEYKDYKRYYSLTNRLFKQMSPFENLQPIKNEIQVVINFLERIPESYTSTKKDNVKMRYASYYNLAKIYYYLDDLDQAIYYYQKVIENDYHEGQSKRNIKAIEKLKDLFSVNQVNSRHFPIELEQLASQQTPLQNQLQLLDAEIQIIDGELLEGKIELSSGGDNVLQQLSTQEVVVFKFLNDNDEIESKNLYSEFIEYIQLDNAKLQRISFISKPRNNNQNFSNNSSNKQTISAFALELFASDKVSLFDADGELVLKKPNETLGQSTSSVAFSFAFKKKLGKFFADCTNMQADIKSSAYKNNAESLMQAVKDYSQCED